jgi:ferritin-like protein
MLVPRDRPEDSVVAGPWRSVGRKEATYVAHEGLHESPDLLDGATIDRHRALESLVEELEAIDWYDQRFHATQDPELASILAHNRDDEKEHAAMALEWIRRHDVALDEQLRLYLFTSGPIVSEEDNADVADEATAPAVPSGGLGIGSLRGRE